MSITTHTLIRETALGLVLAAGACSSPITTLDALVSEKIPSTPTSIDDLLRHTFTPEAYAALKDIPVVDGGSFGFTESYAIGVNVWSRFAGILTGNGPGKKIVVDGERMRKYSVDLHNNDVIGRWQTLSKLLEEKENSSPEKGSYFDQRIKALVNAPFTAVQRSMNKNLIHEYLHHADALGFIDHDAFEQAYARFNAEEYQPYATIHHTVEAVVDNTSWYYWVFGLDETSERLAYVGAHFAADPPAVCPSYLQAVYQRVLTFENPWEDKIEEKTEAISFLNYRMR